ncbi:MAG: dihydroxyacetone kinase subunit DhaK [Actinobacteria bacterium]|nr:dihydroxyacetone kinase subunit DhaK [Actinomycetota bacterium]
MRKLINVPKDIVNEEIDGFVAANKNRIKRIGEYTIIARKDIPLKDEVAIVTGGGSGHEPLFLEYVGKGMADAAAHGQIFASPSSAIILEAIKAADGGRGVLLVYCNYAGDVLNFDMAQEMARDEGLKVDQVRINDDVSSGPKDRREGRRGTTATPIILKIAGAASSTGMEFEALKTLVQRAVDNSRSLGVSLSACTLPETGMATFTLEDGKMEFGMGLHGEAGTKKVDIMTADETAKTILDLLIDDLPFNQGDEVIALINGYGSTTKMEMYIISRKIHSYLVEKGMSVYSTEIGEFCTSQEMAGISITLVKLDAELKKYYDMPCEAPGFKKY